MRSALATLVLLAGCAEAQAACRYNLYIYEPANGASVYAITGPSGAGAVEVRGCGDASLLSDAQAVVESLHHRRDAGGLGVITVVGRGSRTMFGECSAEDYAANSDDHDSMIVVEDASAAQMRRTINSLDAAPREVREQLIAAAGMRNCATRS